MEELQFNFQEALAVQNNGGRQYKANWLPVLKKVREEIIDSIKELIPKCFIKARIL